LAECSEKVAASHFAALGQSDPQLAEVIRYQLQWARHRMTKQKTIHGAPDGTH
jgi:hypothetical protein